MPRDLPLLRPLVLLDDEPAQDAGSDNLQLNVFARIIAETSIGTPGPFTIGVFADWGSGKSSVLRQAKTLLEASPHADELVTVWFNAWHIEPEEHPIVPLVATVLQRVATKRNDVLAQHSSNRASGPILMQTWTKITESLQNLAYGFSVKLQIPGFELAVANAPEDDNQLKRRTLAASAIEALNKCLRAQCTGGDSVPKIVVFVDDLDRSTPDQAIRLLEGIKLALSQPGFVFVLAVDPRVIESFLEKRYKEEFNVPDYRASGTSYLDKIVQLPLLLPPHNSRFETYIERLLSTDLLHEDLHVLQVLRSLKSLLALGCNYNPRTLKRFVNNLLVDRRIRELLYAAEELAQEHDLSGLQDNDFIRLCAVSRSLALHLDGRCYRLLSDDHVLCEAICAGGEKGTAIAARWEDKAQPNRTFENRRSVLQALDQRDFLVRLLDSSIGRRWLQDHAGRKAVSEFLQIQPPPELPATEKDLIDRAIRKALGKHESQPLSAHDLDTVTELDLTELPVSDDSMQYLVGLSGLRNLKLCGTDVSDEGLRCFRSHSVLRSLDMRRTRLSDSGIQHLVGIRGLQELCARHTLLTDEGLRQLAVLDSLRSLDVAFTKVTEDGLAHVARLSALENLDISFLPIEGTGIRHLASLRSLSVLSVYETKLRDDSILELSHLSGLRVLYLGRTPITDVGLRHVSRLSQLQRLDVFDTKITDLGVSRLVGMARLRSLNLASTRISDEAVQYLVQLTSLEEVDVRDTSISEGGVARLRDALPACRIGIG